MAYTAILYDIHGNLRALEAAINHAHTFGTERYLLGGDYALFGPSPKETVNRLRLLENAAWIRGNVDRWCAHPADAGDDELLQGAIADCRRALGDSVVAELGALPERRIAHDIFFCHASPLSDVRSFLPEAAEDEDELLSGASEPRVVFGHTHLQFRRTRSDGVELINPGSVGMPLDGDPRAAYALLRDDGTVRLERVDYDHEAAAAEVGERFGDAPWVARSQQRLREARP